MEMELVQTLMKMFGAGVVFGIGLAALSIAIFGVVVFLFVTSSDFCKDLIKRARRKKDKQG